MLLPNFPMVSQLTTVTGDGKPSENSQMDCVAASIDAYCRYLLGTPENSVFNPDHFKDEVYGDAYKGGTSAQAYVAFCQSLGIHLYASDTGNARQTVAVARSHIQEGRPVIFTMLDPYVDTSLPQYQGWTHVCVWFGEDAQGLTALDPYIGKPVYKSDAAWASLLRSNQFWVAEKMAPPVSGVPTGWRDASEVLTAPNGVAVVLGFRKHVLENHWDKDNWPLEKEHGTDLLEGSNPALGKGTQQIFRWKMLGWSVARGVFEEWLGQELLFTRQQVLKYYTLASQLHATALKLQADVQELQKEAQGA